MNAHDQIPEFQGKHDPILVPAAKMDAPWTLWKWWCPCGGGSNSGPQDYVGASKSADAHVEAKTRAKV